MIADLSSDAGIGGAALDHGVGVDAGQGGAGELLGLAADGAEQRPLGIIGEAGAFDILSQILLEIMVAGHFVALAAFLSQAHPEPPAFVVNVFDLHAEGGTDAGEAIDHQADQRTIAQAAGRRHIDAVEQLAGFRRFQDRACGPCARCAWGRALSWPD